MGCIALNIGTWSLCGPEAGRLPIGMMLPLPSGISQVQCSKQQKQQQQQQQQQQLGRALSGGLNF